MADDEEENYGLAFGLVIAAGLSTSIGASLVFCDRYVEYLQNREGADLFLGAALGFSAGVMIFISMTEIFNESIADFAACECLWEDDVKEGEEPDEGPAYMMAVLTFFLGVSLTFGLDYVVHVLLADKLHRRFDKGSPLPNMIDRTPTSKDTVEKQKESKTQTTGTGTDTEFMLKDNTKAEDGKVESLDKENKDILDEQAHEKLEFTGLMTAVAIGLHNFPEGLATFSATLVDPQVGVGLAFAIAVHNIPEGLCVAIPIYHATGSRWKGFAIAFLSGFCEIIGAFLGYLFLRTVVGPATFGVLFGIVSGMMVTIVLKELLPTAHRYDPSDRFVTNSVFLGIFVMAISIMLFTL